MKRERQQAILRLVRERRLSTQAEVAQALRTEGFEAVQTTVSRDIAELGLVKVRAADGELVYSAGVSRGHGQARLGIALRRFALEIEPAGPLVVVRTPSGCAPALAQSLDESALPQIAGTIAGDNTIFVAPREGTSARALAEQLNRQLLEDVA